MVDQMDYIPQEMDFIPQQMEEYDYVPQGLEPMPSFAPMGHSPYTDGFSTLPNVDRPPLVSLGINPQLESVIPYSPGPRPPMGPNPYTPGLSEFGLGQTSRPPFYPPWQNPQQNFRRCLNRISVVTLINGNSFWFYPTEMRRNTLVGFRWRRSRWEPSIIDLNRVRFVQCS